METERPIVKALCSLLLVVALACTLGMAQQNGAKQEHVVLHTVKQGETLWTIGEKYSTPDRYLPEFIEGIYELNYDNVFRDREQNGARRKSVYPGDRLEIHFWR